MSSVYFVSPIRLSMQKRANFHWPISTTLLSSQCGGEYPGLVEMVTMTSVAAERDIGKSLAQYMADAAPERARYCRSPCHTKLIDMQDENDNSESDCYHGRECRLGGLYEIEANEKRRLSHHCRNW